jgi:hypothetical protein
VDGRRVSGARLAAAGQRIGNRRLISAQAANGYHINLLRKFRPLWAEVLETASHDDAEQVIKEISQQTMALAKVRALLEDHPPAPPPQRAAGRGAIGWDEIEGLIMTVYGLRSDAVHEGLPPPAPLLGPFLPRSDPPPERPDGTIGSGDSVWTEADMPMYLHTFVYVVGEVLRSWWQSLADDPPTP